MFIVFLNQVGNHQSSLVSCKNKSRIMTPSPPTGFFAYPSTPKTISETIRTAVSNLNKSDLVHIKVWEDCRVGGKVIVDEICREIVQADLFCADLTHLNANVMFELGYAIAKNKRVWLARYLNC